MNKCSMKNIAIIEPDENLNIFLSVIKLNKSAEVFFFEENLFSDTFLLAIRNSILIIGQETDWENIDVSNLYKFALSNTVFILTCNVPKFLKDNKKQYSYLKPLISLIYDGNTVTEFSTCYKFSS